MIGKYPKHHGFPEVEKTIIMFIENFDLLISDRVVNMGGPLPQSDFALGHPKYVTPPSINKFLLKASLMCIVVENSLLFLKKQMCSYDQT